MRESRDDFDSTNTSRYPKRGEWYLWRGNIQQANDDHNDNSGGPREILIPKACRVPKESDVHCDTDNSPCAVPNTDTLCPSCNVAMDFEADRWLCPECFTSLSDDTPHPESP